jgi:hypothetical protein
LDTAEAVEPGVEQLIPQNASSMSIPPEIQLDSFMERDFQS